MVVLFTQQHLLLLATLLLSCFSFGFSSQYYAITDTDQASQYYAITDTDQAIFNYQTPSSKHDKTDFVEVFSTLFFSSSENTQSTLFFHANTWKSRVTSKVRPTNTSIKIYSWHLCYRFHSAYFQFAKW